MHDDGIIRVCVCLCREAHKHTVKKKTREKATAREKGTEKQRVNERKNDDKQTRVIAIDLMMMMMSYFLFFATLVASGQIS